MSTEPSQHVNRTSTKFQKKQQKQKQQRQQNLKKPKKSALKKTAIVCSSTVYQ